MQGSHYTQNDPCGSPSHVSIAENGWNSEYIELDPCLKRDILPEDKGYEKPKKKYYITKFPTR